MWTDHMWMGGMWIFPVFMLAIVLVFIFVVFGRRDSRSSKVEDRNYILRDEKGETALDILKKRYARGEITKEEFDKIKADL